MIQELVLAEINHADIAVDVVTPPRIGINNIPPAKRMAKVLPNCSNPVGGKLGFTGANRRMKVNQA